MLDGADYRHWRTRALTVEKRPAPATLELRLEQSRQFVQVHVAAQALAPALGRDASLYLAVYENALVSRVARGENAQRTLRHDYVVRAWSRPHALPARHRFALASSWQRQNLGVAAVLIAGDGSTLQAVSRSACP